MKTFPASLSKSKSTVHKQTKQVHILPPVQGLHILMDELSDLSPLSLTHPSLLLLLSVLSALKVLACFSTYVTALKGVCGLCYVKSHNAL